MQGIVISHDLYFLNFFTCTLYTMFKKIYTMFKKTDQSLFTGK